MNFLVKYVCFHPDNHQGGSGKSFTHEVFIKVEGIFEMKDLRNKIYVETKIHAEQSVPYIQDSKFTILEVKTFV